VRALRWNNAGSLFLDGSAPAISFGQQTRQHLNLWSTSYGIGVQSSTMYFRSGGGFAWFRSGTHADGTNDPGSGGARLATMNSGGSLRLEGTIDIWANVFARTFSDTDAWANIIFQQANGLQGVVEYMTGKGAYRGSGRRIQLYGGGWSRQMNNGTNIASYDGDGNWDFGSDERIKKEIEDAEPLLDRVLDIQVRRFRYKDQADDDLKKHLGVIAQELLPLFPDLVTQGFPNDDGGEDLLMVAYTDFGLVAIGALQELAQRQEQTNAELRAENADLRAQLEQLQATVSALAETINSGQ
jgi:hypothetical protein